MNGTETNTDQSKTRNSKRMTTIILYGILVGQLCILVLSLFFNVPHFVFPLVCILLAPVLGLLSIFELRQKKGLVITVAVLYLVIVTLSISGYRQAMTYFSHEDCEDNLRMISRALYTYTKNNRGRYPAPQKWCDLLVEETNLSKARLCCKGAKNSLGNYAINPSATPTSPRNMVLLFETNEGWNQSGGPELLTTDNHWKKGCNVLFVGGYVGFVESKWFGSLEWKIENYRKKSLSP